MIDDLFDEAMIGKVGALERLYANFRVVLGDDSPTFEEEYQGLPIEEKIVYIVKAVRVLDAVDPKIAEDLAFSAVFRFSRDEEDENDIRMLIDGLEGINVRYSLQGLQGKYCDKLDQIRQKYELMVDRLRSLG
jgi:hypothetical protein